MPDGVIERDKNTALDQDQPLFGNGAPFFKWAPDVEIMDGTAAIIILDDDVPEGVIEEKDEEEIKDEDEGAEYPNEDNFEHDGGHGDDAGTEGKKDQMEDEDVKDHGNRLDSMLEESNANSDRETKDVDSGTKEPAEETPEEDQIPIKDTRTPGQIRHNLRTNRGRNYDNRFAHAMDDPANTKSYDAQFLQQGVSYKPTLRAAVQEMRSTGSATNVVITGIVMMQLTAKAGIKKHGQVAHDALFKEFS
jgi:hypothetical protein